MNKDGGAALKTREDVEKLKYNWFRDPIWDIETTEGFEEYHDELLAYRKECEARWEKKWQEEQEAEKAEAEKLGLHGLFKRIKELEELQERYYRAISYLADNQTTLAHKALNGRDD